MDPYLFRKVSDGARAVYYTHPSKIKQQYTTEEILVHYRKCLQENKQWIWVFDGSNFDTDHIMELKLGQGIAEILDSPVGQTLKEILVINPTVHLKVLIKVVTPFISDPLMEKVKILEGVHSILEYL